MKRHILGCVWGDDGGCFDSARCSRKERRRTGGYGSWGSFQVLLTSIGSVDFVENSGFSLFLTHFLNCSKNVLKTFSNFKVFKKPFFNLEKFKYNFRFWQNLSFSNFRIIQKQHFEKLKIIFLLEIEIKTTQILLTQCCCSVLSAESSSRNWHKKDLERVSRSPGKKKIFHRLRPRIHET